MIKMLISVLISINLFYLAFAQDTIEGRWHLVGYEDNVMYQFEDNYRYSIYSTDGTFGDIEDAGGTPNPYTVVEDIITIDLFFGTIVNYQMNFMCDGQVVEFKNIDYGTIHSKHFREGYDYQESPCNDNSTLCDNDYIEINGNCYYQSDLDVLNIFIENSPEINPILDTNNNGIIESLELCTQSWQDGRLQLLDCGPIIINGNYNWLEISGEVPYNIENWSEIEILIMSYNNLSGLVPDNICELNLNFNDPNIFSFYGNDLCPPYPECIEDYIGTQSNWGSGSCELSNCYDVGVTQITALELNGDDLINSYDDLYGSAHLLVTMHNDGPHCSQYPGLMITADIDGTSFPTEENESSVSWWYAIFANDTYFSDITFEISSYIPPGTEITLTAESVIMGCLVEGCSEDPYCHDCPLTDPVSITLTIGNFFPSQIGDANTDNDINILDVVLVVSFILNDTSTYYYDEANAMQIYLSNINQDNNIDVLDVVMLVDIILNA